MCRRSWDSIATKGGGFVTRSFPSGVTLEQYQGWVMNEFGPLGSDVLERYPASTFAAPIEAMARLTGDAQFACEARRLARLIARTGTPAYLYSYEYEIDTLSPDHVIHGVESNVLFGNNYSPPVFPAYVLNEADLALHSAMSGYWTRFATSGNPNTGETVALRWPAFTHPMGKGRGSNSTSSSIP